ncbi:MAG: electron transfer flavoprotein subunit alpha/FixB family protein [Ignavibacteriales bacterium]|nr:electron transfer flavoprotein subunit alpha/FixB family protein [Ignavibacteriales bacterium]
MKILVFAEQRENKFKKPAFEAVRTARTLADQLSGEVVALVIGGSVQSIAPMLGGYGAHKVIAAEDPRLAHYASSAYAKLVADAARAEQADVVVLPATAMGKDLAPRVAVKLDAGLASDCTALSIEGGEILATRPIYAGKVLTRLKITSALKVFTLRPNVFVAGESNGSASPVEAFAVELKDQDLGCIVKETKQSSGRLDVAEADIIVTGGRGLKGPEHFGMIEQLAETLGAAVGASRAVVDAGWRPHDEQVGQTGKTVSPSLYIAVAVSGAIQHLAGMSSSKYIVAINKDKDAPIFQAANYGIVGDAFEIIPALTAEVKKLLGKN